tara:strand:+ start:18282 stop:19433 length:1152 start_codon:yes stop_codon:yes gene_type:complete
MKSLSKISRSFSVKYDYTLYFTENLFSLKNSLLFDVLNSFDEKNIIKTLFIIDDGVYNSHPNIKKKIADYCLKFSTKIELKKILIFKGGEIEKNNKESFQKILKSINDYNICRHSFIIVIGGGAIIDMAGYASTIAHRGVKLIRIPTTVLAQNDAAVGVKNSINEFGKKNFLGTFSPPYAIINDLNFLKTLDQRDWISGIAEAIKVALIKDSTFFDYIEKNSKILSERNYEKISFLIYKCAEIHMDHITNGGDPFENGSSRPLDFGHWAAHKLEFLTNYNLRHGEAVAMGMALDVTYSNMIGLLSDKNLFRILNVLEEIGFDIKIPIQTNNEMEKLLSGIQEFREHLGGKLTITLIKNIGSKIDVNNIDLKIMRNAINKLSKR